MLLWKFSLWSFFNMYIFFNILFFSTFQMLIFWSTTFMLLYQKQKLLLYLSRWLKLLKFSDPMSVLLNCSIKPLEATNEVANIIVIALLKVHQLLIHSKANSMYLASNFWYLIWANLSNYSISMIVVLNSQLQDF